MGEILWQPNMYSQIVAASICDIELMTNQWIQVYCYNGRLYLWNPEHEIDDGEESKKRKRESESSSLALRNLSDFFQFPTRKTQKNYATSIFTVNDELTFDPVAKYIHTVLSGLKVHNNFCDETSMHSHEIDKYSPELQEDIKIHIKKLNECGLRVCEPPQFGVEKMGIKTRPAEPGTVYFTFRTCTSIVLYKCQWEIFKEKFARGLWLCYSQVFSQLKLTHAKRLLTADLYAQLNLASCMNWNAVLNETELSSIFDYLFEDKISKQFENLHMLDSSAKTAQSEMKLRENSELFVLKHICENMFPETTENNSTFFERPSVSQKITTFLEKIQNEESLKRKINSNTKFVDNFKTREELKRFLNTEDSVELLCLFTSNPAVFVYNRLKGISTITNEEIFAVIDDANKKSNDVISLFALEKNSQKYRTIFSDTVNEITSFFFQ